MSSREPTFRVIEDASRRFPIDELDFVTLEFEVCDDDGRLVPAGSGGTVVSVYGEGEAYCVEFTSPFHALATVMPRQIGHVARD